MNPAIQQIRPFDLQREGLQGRDQFLAYPWRQNAALVNGSWQPAPLAPPNARLAKIWPPRRNPAARTAAEPAGDWRPAEGQQDGDQGRCFRGHGQGLCRPACRAAGDSVGNRTTAQGKRRLTSDPRFGNNIGALLSLIERLFLPEMAQGSGVSRPNSQDLVRGGSWQACAAQCELAARLKRWRRSRQGTFPS